MITWISVKRTGETLTDPKIVIAAGVIMCRSIEYMQRDVQQRVILEAIKNIMNAFGFTTQQAMDALKIAEDERPEYIDRIRFDA